MSVRKICDCKIYNKSMADVVEACAKHRDKILAMDKVLNTKNVVLAACHDEIAELTTESYNLKFKVECKDLEINAMKETYKGLQEEIDSFKLENQNLRIEMKDQRKNEIQEKIEIGHLKSEIVEKDNKLDVLKHELQEKCMEKNEMKKELAAKVATKENEKDVIIALKGELSREKLRIIKLEEEVKAKDCEVKDLMDENNTYNEKNRELEGIVDRQNEKDILKSSSGSLEDEITTAESNIKLNELEQALKFTESKLNEVLKHNSLMEVKILKFEKSKDEKLGRIKQLEELSDKREEQFEKLKLSVKNLKPENKPRCKFGWSCRRAFCKFDHTYLRSKVNCNKPKGSDQPVTTDLTSLLCEVCGKTFKTGDEFECHIERCKADSSGVLRSTVAEGGPSKQYECELCLKGFTNDLHLKEHKNAEHISDEIECSKCGIYFVSYKELKSHVEGEHLRKKIVTKDISELEHLVGNISLEKPDEMFLEKEKKSPLQKTQRKMKTHKKVKHEVVKPDQYQPEILSDGSDRSLSDSFSCTSSSGSSSSTSSMDSSLSV